MMSKQDPNNPPPGYGGEGVPHAAYYNQPPEYPPGQPSVYPDGPMDYQNQGGGQQPFGYPGNQPPFPPPPGNQPPFPPFGGGPGGGHHAAMRGMMQGQLQQHEIQGFEDKAVRRGFIRKVYGILMCQLLLTAAIMAVFMFVSPVKT